MNLSCPPALAMGHQQGTLWRTPHILRHAPTRPGELGPGLTNGSYSHRNYNMGGVAISRGNKVHGERFWIMWH